MGITARDVDRDTWAKLQAAASAQGTPTPAASKGSKGGKPVPVEPAVTLHAAVMTFTLPILTASEANQRQWQGKARRTSDARRAVSRAFGRHLRRLASYADHYHAGGVLLVTLTRLGGKGLDRTVNLPSALKAVEDGVATVLGADDGSPLWRCRCEQEPGPKYGVRIRLEKA